MKKLNLSVIIFTSNSASVIERAIKSASSADEIIVFDSGSTDDTVKIAKKHTKNVIQIQFIPYVEPQREQALTHATHEWVLFLDADEEAPENLEEMVTYAQERNVVVNIPRKNMIFGKWIEHSGYWPDRHPRLFKKGSVIWHTEIHSKPTINAEIYNVPAIENNALIHHHYTSVTEWILRMDRYTSVKVKELQDVPFVWTSVLTAPLAEFLRRYFAWEGYKDGLHGLVIALLDAVYSLMIALKQWEMIKFAEPQESVTLTRVEKEFLALQKELGYWFREIALKSAKNTSEKILMRLKQKIRTSL